MPLITNYTTVIYLAELGKECDTFGEWSRHQFHRSLTTPYIVISVLLMLSLDFGQFIGFIGLMLLVVHQEKHLFHKIE